MNFFACQDILDSNSCLEPISGNGFKYVKQISSTRFAVAIDIEVNIYTIGTFTLEARLYGHSSQVMFFSILSDGLLISSCLDGSVRWWNPDSEVLLDILNTPIWPNSYVKRFLELENRTLVFCYSRIHDYLTQDSAESIELFSNDPNSLRDLTKLDEWTFKSGYDCNGLLTTNSSVLFINNDKIKLVNRTNNKLYSSFTSFDAASYINNMEIIEGRGFYFD